MNELKKSVPEGLQFFLFHLVVSCSVCVLLEFEATSHNTMFVGRVVAFSCWGESQFTALMNNTSPNSFSVDFIYFKYRF